MIGPSIDRLDIGAIILIEIDRVWTKDDLFSADRGPALAEVVIAPGKDVTETCHYECVCLATSHRLKLIVK